VIAAHQQGNQREALPSTAFTSRVFTVFSIGRLNCSTSSAMVLAFGVSTRSSPEWRPRAALSAQRLPQTRCLPRSRRVREDHIVFAALRQHLEFMRCAAADRTGVSLYRGNPAPYG
jgi:hypothetical protein